MFNTTRARNLVKASVRKQVEKLLKETPRTRKLYLLKDEFERKGFLSKRELKQLMRLHAEIKAA